MGQYKQLVWEALQDDPTLGRHAREVLSGLGGLEYAGRRPEAMESDGPAIDPFSAETQFGDLAASGPEEETPEESLRRAKWDYETGKAMKAFDNPLSWLGEEKKASAPSRISDFDNVPHELIAMQRPRLSPYGPGLVDAGEDNDFLAALRRRMERSQQERALDVNPFAKLRDIPDDETLLREGGPRMNAADIMGHEIEKQGTRFLSDLLSSELGPTDIAELALRTGGVGRTRAPATSQGYWSGNVGEGLPSRSDIERIRKDLSGSEGKNFVRRILSPEKSMVLDPENGVIATHKMSYSTLDGGKAMMYPTIVEKDGELVELSPDDAVKHARETGEYVVLPEREAAWLSENYKKLWDKKPEHDVVSRGLLSAAGAIDRTTSGIRDSLRKSYEETLSPEERRTGNAGLMTDVAGVMGSISGFVGTAAAIGKGVTRILSRGAKDAATLGRAAEVGRDVATAFSTVSESAMEGKQAWQDAIASGASEEDALAKMLGVAAYNLPLNFVTEKLGWFGDNTLVRKALNGIPEGRVRDIIQTGMRTAADMASETTQEGLQGIGQEVAKGKELTPGLVKEQFEAVAAPTAIGSGLLGIAHGAAGVRAQKAARDAEDRTRRLDRIERGAYERHRDAKLPEWVAEYENTKEPTAEPIAAEPQETRETPPVLAAEETPPLEPKGETPPESAPREAGPGVVVEQDAKPENTPEPTAANPQAEFVSRVESAANEREKDRIFAEKGAELFPTLRLGDQFDAGRFAYRVAKGEMTQEEFDGVVDQWRNEGRFRSVESKKTETPDKVPDIPEQSDAQVTQTVAAQHGPASIEEPVKNAPKTGADGVVRYRQNGELRETPVRYKIVDADDLVTSRNEGYPAELQPRDTNRANTDLRVGTMAADLKPELLGFDEYADRGAPTVTRGNIVVAGNHRAWSIGRAYDTGTDGSSKYREYVASVAQRIGDDPERVRNMKRPVLVRELEGTDGIDLKAFAEDANTAVVADMSAAEQAKSDAEKITDAMLNTFEVDDAGTIGRDFVEAFAGKIVRDTERGRFMDQDGFISQDGIRRIRNALLAKAYGDSALVGRISESTDDNSKRISNGLMQGAPVIARMEERIARGLLHPFSIRKDIMEAVRTVHAARTSGRNIEEFLGDQVGLFDDKGLSSEAKIIARFLSGTKASAKAVREFLVRYVQNVERLGDPNEQTIAGLEADVPTKSELVNRLLSEFAVGPRESGGLFDGVDSRPVPPKKKPNAPARIPVRKAFRDMTRGEIEAEEAQVRDETKQRLVAAGRKPEVADAEAAVYARGVRVAAERRNMSPMEWERMRGPKVQKGTAGEMKTPDKAAAQRNRKSDATFDQVAYHGSPHRFGRFDTESIGSGEGAQAYGWGLYFTGSKDIAEWYRERLQDDDMTIMRLDDGVVFDSGNGWVYIPNDDPDGAFQVSDTVEQLVFDIMGDPEIGIDKTKALAAIDAFLEDPDSQTNVRALSYLDEDDVPLVEKARDGIEEWLIERGEPGQLYKVEIPEDNEYLLWDKSLEEQPSKVQSALKQAGEAEGEDFSDLSGEEIYQQLGRSIAGTAQAAARWSDKKVSLYLNSLGIKGIKYLDGWSRNDGEGGYNYVLFNDEDADITRTFYERGVGRSGSVREYIRKKAGSNDQAYLDAVERGDTETAQRMVDEAAKGAGFSAWKLWHGSKKAGHTIFDLFFAGKSGGQNLGVGVYFSESKKWASVFAGKLFSDPMKDAKKKGIWYEYDDGGGVMAVYGPNIRKILDLGRDPKDRKDLRGALKRRLGANPDNPSDITEKARALGYEGIASIEGTDYQVVIFDTTKIKSADPVTYDDNGRIIPLSQRFDATTPDIRRQEGGSDDAPVRGSITFKGSGKATISLFESADESTFLHEAAHLFLQDFLDASNSKALDELGVADFRALDGWLGGFKRDKKSGKLTASTKQHEKFARGFEQYLREGKPPVASLKGAFEKFASWLKGIYKRATSLGVKMTPEVRSIYDSFLTTKEERSEKAAPQETEIQAQEETKSSPQKVEKQKEADPPPQTKKKPELVGYEWRSMKGEKYSSREYGLIPARVSDWGRYEISEGSGREIVHVYWIRGEDGKVAPYGKQTAAKALGLDGARLAKKVDRFIEEQQKAKAIKDSDIARWNRIFEGAKATSVKEANREYRMRNIDVATSLSREGKDVLDGTAVYEKDGKMVTMTKNPALAEELGFSIVRDNDEMTAPPKEDALEEEPPSAEPSNTDAEPAVTEKAESEIPESGVELGVGDDETVEKLVGSASIPRGWEPKMPAERADAEPIKIDRIRDLVDRIVRWRFGRITEDDVMGIHKPKEQIVRTREQYDFPTALHEVGHNIVEKLGLRKSMPKAMLQELATLGVRTSPPGSGVPYVINEGMAQFVQAYGIDKADAKAQAPLFFDEFEKQLAAHPDLAAILEDVFTATRDYFAATPQKRLQAAMYSVRDRGPVVEGVQNRLRGFWYSAQEKFLDRFLPVRLVTEEIRKAYGSALPDDLNLYAQFRTLEGYLKQADRDVQRMLDPVRGLGEADYAALNTYLLAARSIDYYKNKMNPGTVSRVEAERIVRETDPRIVKVADEIRNAYDQMVDGTLLASGIVNRSQLDAMRTAWPNYVPFVRDLGDEGAIDDLVSGTIHPAGGKRVGNIQEPDALKKTKGMQSEHERTRIEDPFEVMVRNAVLYHGIAARNRVGRSLVGAAEKVKGMGWLAERLDDDGASKKDSAFWVWEDGKKTYYATDPEIYAVVTGLTAQGNSFTNNSVVKLVEQAADLFKLGTTRWNPAFMLINLMRDATTVAVQSESFAPPLANTVRGLLMLAKDDPLIADAIEDGVFYSALTSLPRGTDMKAVAGEIHRALRKSPTGKTVNAILGAWNTVGQASENVEIAPKLAEYRRLRQKGVARKEAAMRAREINTDFQRAGSWGRVINRYVPFFNAGLQGVDKAARSFRDAPVRTSVKTMLYVMLPSLLLRLMMMSDPEREKKYMQIDDRIRDAYWIVPTSGDSDSWIRIPKPFELGVLFGASVERGLSQLFAKDPDAWRGYATSVQESMLPSILPQLFAPWLETWANRSFYYDSPLVSRSKEGLPEELQYRATTTETAKAVGKLFGVSPIKVDHIWRGYTGTVGANVLSGVEAMLAMTGALKPKNLEAKKLGEYPFLNAFMVVPGRGDEPLDRFYDIGDRLSKGTAGAKAKGEPYADASIAKVFSDARRELGTFWKDNEAVRASKKWTPEEKREKMDRQTLRAIRVAEEALRKYYASRRRKD